MIKDLQDRIFVYKGNVKQDIPKFKLATYEAAGWTIGKTVERPLHSFTVVQLKAKCREQNIGYSNKIRKQDLINLLSGKVVDTTDEPQKNVEDSNEAPTPIVFEDGLII